MYVAWSASHASTKTLDCNATISSSSFCRELADYYSHVFSLIYPMPLDEFSFEEVRTWGQSEIASCCQWVWCNSRELYRRGESKIPNTSGSKLLRRLFTTYKQLLGRVTFGIHPLAKSWSSTGASCQPAFVESCLILTHVWPVYLVDTLSWVFYKKLLDRVAYGILMFIDESGATLPRYAEHFYIIELVVVMLMVFFQAW